MILRNKIIIITLITIVALVGVGYATWTLATEKTSDVNGGGSVMAAIEASNVVVKDADGNAITDLYIICASPNDEDMYWSTSSDGSDRIAVLKLYGSVNENDFDYLDFSTYTGTFTSTMTGAPNSTNWINLPVFNLEASVTSEDKDDDVCYTYTLPELSYKQTPETMTQVSALHTEVNALSLTITIGFRVTSVA